MTSSNGIDWTIRTSAANNSWRSVCWSSELGIFVAVSDSGTGNRVMTSSDGINWIIRSSSANESWYSICWSPQLRLFVAVSHGGPNGVMTSPDGITWTNRTANNYLWTQVCWSPEIGIFCAVAYDGGAGTDRVMTSSLKGRPPTSYDVFDSSFNLINELGLWNFQSFSRGVPVTKTADFTVQPGENWIIVNKPASAATVTLPAANLWTGEELMFKTIAAQPVVSSLANVIPLAGGTPTTSILSGTIGKWATLVSNGTNWVIRMAN